MLLTLISQEFCCCQGDTGSDDTLNSEIYNNHINSLKAKGYSRKKYLGGEEGKCYIFLWVVGADIFQIIWVIGV